MIRQTLTLWDCVAEPPEADDLVYSWDGYSATGRGRSLLAYVDTHADRLRNKYLAWIHELGESQIDGKKLVDHLALEENLSFWWMTLLVEKSPWKSPAITDALRLLAFEEVVKEHNPGKIRVVSANRSLHEVVGGLCLELGIPRTSQRLSGKSLRRITARDAYRALPQALQAPISLARYLRGRWRFRRKRATVWFGTDRTMFFCSYFIHLDEKFSTQGKFYSHIWEGLPQLLQDAGFRTNWLQHYIQSPMIPNIRVAHDWVNRFNRHSAAQGHHSLLDTYLSWGIVFRVLNRWRKLNLVSWRLRGQQLRRIFQPQGSHISLWPVMREDWYAGLIGPVAAENLLWIELFDAALREFPRQEQGLYPCEGQGWERALIHSWRKHGHGRLVAVAHSTVRFWDLRYFADPRSVLSAHPHSMPQADYIALNGKAAVDAYLSVDFPPDLIVECEALRYGYLKDLRLVQPSTKLSGHALKVLILGDIASSSTTRLLQLLQSAIPHISADLAFTMKPHPKWTVKPENFPSLRLKVNTSPLADILAEFDIAYSTNLTSAAVDAYLAGLSVIVMLDPTELNFSPLRGQPGVRFVNTPAELAAALQPRENSDVHREIDDFFFLAADFHRWRRLLGINAGGTT